MKHRNDIEDDFPVDETDYHFKLLEESRTIANQLLETTDPQEKEQLNKRYLEIQKWISEIAFDNSWDE